MEALKKNENTEKNDEEVKENLNKHDIGNI